MKLRIQHLVFVLVVGILSLPGADATDAAKAWQELYYAMTHPPLAPPPVSRDGKPPPEEEVAAWRKKREEVVIGIVDKAKDFYTRFPNDPNAANARIKEKELIDIGVKLGIIQLVARLDPAEAQRLKDEQRFVVRFNGVQSDALAKEAEGIAAVMAKFEEGARALVKDFPDRPESYHWLSIVMMQGDAPKMRQIAEELLAGKAPEALKHRAASTLAKLAWLGKVIDIKFTSIDGREVDVAALKGKVVLLDFWATWCGPCVAGVPDLLAAYEKLHGKGFEIVGVSFDQEKEALTGFVADRKVPWPQYFEEGAGNNVFGEKYGIDSWPTLWLLDKTGKLREMNAREDLAGKVEKLLAE